MPGQIGGFYDNDVIIVPCDYRFNNLEIGWQYIVDQGIPFPSQEGCPFKKCEIKKAIHNAGDNYRIISDFIQNESEYISVKEINVKAAANYAFAGGGIATGGGYSNKISYQNNANSVYWYLEVLKISRTDYISDYEVSKSIKEGYYVSTISYGQKIKFIFSYNAKDQFEAASVKKIMTAQINYLNSGGSMSAEQTSEVQSIYKSENLKMELIAQGISDPFSINNIINSHPGTVRNDIKTILDKNADSESPIFLGVKHYYSERLTPSAKENIIAQAIFYNNKLVNEVNLIDKIIYSERITPAEKESYKLYELKAEKSGFSRLIANYTMAYINDASSENEKVLFDYLQTNMKRFDYLKLPKWQSEFGQATSILGDNSSQIVTLYLEPESEYEISYSYRIWPIDWGSGYMEGNATFSIQELNFNQTTPSFMTQNSDVAKYGNKISIKTNRSYIYNMSLFINSMKWSNPSKEIRNQVYNVELIVNATRKGL